MEFVDQQAASPSPAAADEDPAAFLQSIRELTAKREREDAERFKKLEEEVKRSREERANRRLERARSISPEKANSTNDSPALRSPTNVSRSEKQPPVTPPPKSTASTMDHAKAAAGPPSPTKDIPEFKGFGSARNSAASMSSMMQSPDRTSQTPQSATSLARSGTLSWQQRPPSRAGSRPISVAKPEPNNMEKSTVTPQSSEPSRDQIAESLGARDPSWFRQTADRGIGSAAYRKSKDEPSAAEMSRSESGRKGLPGLSRESKELERQSSPAPSESMRSDAITRPSSTTRNSMTSSRFSVASSSTSTPSKPELKSLIAEDAQQQEASPLSDTTSSNGGDRPGLGRKLTMSSSQARLADATDRPSSPTKGMGGFVSSAMMKRSDSVSKRWSAQTPPSLSRHGSVASVRNGLGGLQGSHSMPKLEPTADRREAIHEQQPMSSSSNNLPGLAQAAQDENEFVKPALPRHSRSKSVASNYTTNEHDGVTSPPGSPSKRFSPTKSSWIESALTQRPESPKPSTAKNSQPSWMANIAKAKAERGSSDLTSPTSTPKSTEVGTPARGAAPFGQGMLKRSDSRDLAPTPRSSTPPIARELHKLDDKPDVAAAASSMSSPKIEKPEPAVPIKSPSLAEPFSPQTAAKTPAADASKVLETDLATIEKPSTPAKELAKSPSTASLGKTKPEAPAKPQTDFRATLRSRPRPEAKQQDAPEFLSKFGQLRKTQPEKFVAPDVFKDNITRGKNDLTKTAGPVKTARRDELKESLLAKKDDWKKAKDEGRELPGAVHERKISATTPLTPSKPEALARRELLGRQGSVTSSPEKPKQATPEALARHKSLKEQPETPALKREATFPTESAKLETLSKQTSAPTVTPSKPQTETSKLASRFNPGLAGLLARGPPAPTSGTSSPVRTSTPLNVPHRSEAATPAEAAAEGPLQDMRKGRAKGPKKRKQGGADVQSNATDKEQSEATPQPQPQAKTAAETEMSAKGPVIAAASTPLQAPKPRAPAGSAASVMMASLRSPEAQDSPVATEKPFTPTIPSKSLGLAVTKPPDTTQADTKKDVPTFTGFNSVKKSTAALQNTIKPKNDDDKENSANETTSVKSAASMWAKQASPKKTAAPPQIQLPSKKDEEAAMRSAGLLASSPAGRSPSRGLGIDVPKGPRDLATPPGSAGLPPKPAKSSRVVSGQLQEASPNKSRSGSPRPLTEAERVLARSFGSIPRSSLPLKLDTRVIMASSSSDTSSGGRTTRKTIQAIMPDGAPKTLSQQDEYTLFEDAIYVCGHSHINGNAKKAEAYIWRGSSASDAAFEQGKAAAKKLAYEMSAGAPVVIHQGHEPSSFLQALGGIMVTRRGGREGTSKQYMLCGRKHFGHITFDEVDFAVSSLCAGFVYLISYPVTLQQTKLYLWKGSACSTEEISAARLAAMDLSETGEIIEVDNGAEFASFLRIFGVGTTKASVPKATPYWRQKALAPDRFEIHLFRVQQFEEKPSLFTSLLNRRPSWNGRSPARENEEIKVEAKHIAPFCQNDLEAEGIYLLDAHSELYLVLGPLFPSQQERLRDTLLGQALLFTAEYAEAAGEQRPMAPKASVLFRGFPPDLRALFRHWDEQRGLWGTAGLMAGIRASMAHEVKVAPVDDVLKAVCQA